MTTNDEVKDVDNEVEVEAAEVETDTDSTDWKEKYEETTGRLKRLETKLEKLKVEKKAEEIVEKRSKTDELDESQLNYLELKGYSEDDDINVIQRHVQRTGETVRQALKDDYVIAKLEANKVKREVGEATPSSTKRSGQGSVDDLASAIAKFEQTGKLPSDFALASKVTNAITDRASNKPSWH